MGWRLSEILSHSPIEQCDVSIHLHLQLDHVWLDFSPMLASIDQLILDQNATIRQALEALEKNLIKAVFIVSIDQKVVGSITDGDIRRAMLRGEGLETPLHRVSNSRFISAEETSSSEYIVSLMREYGVRQIPVLDSNGRLKDIKTLDEFVSQATLDIPAVIMAGGKGTRLYPLTKDTPKPLLKVGDLSIIERLVVNLKAQGVNRFLVSVNHMADQIMAQLGDGSKANCRIDYVHESQPLGTAGSLSLMKKHLHGDFFVLNGDIIFTVDLGLLKEFHAAHRSIATVCSKVFEFTVPYGVMQLEGSDIKGMQEKPKYSFFINSGIYLFSDQIFDYIHDNEALDMPELLKRVTQSGKSIKCFQSYEPWVDIGSREEFHRAQQQVEYLS